MKPSHGQAALTFPSLKKDREIYLGRRKGSESEDMALTSSLPGLQPSCLMETGGVLEHSLLLENIESWDVRAGRDVRGQSVHPLLHSHFTDEHIKEQREKATRQVKSRARPN